jgi:thiamine biosynthesis lipoprotein
VSEASGGAFDVTVGPLVDAWGFGPEGRLSGLPDEERLAELRESVGFEGLAMDREAGTLSKTHPATLVDLSGIAKGYGVDQVATALLELGYTAYLVEIGGEVKVRGRKPDGSAWRVAIEAPESERRVLHRVVELVDMAVATSGDYRNFYEEDGVRYAHIIDPRTGHPVRHAGAAVSVLHRDAVVADAWATALSVLGPEEGMAVAEREGLAALFITAGTDGYETFATAGFPETEQFPVAPGSS